MVGKCLPHTLMSNRPHTLVGKEVEYLSPDGRRRIVQVVGYEYTPSVIETPEGRRYRGVRFRVQTNRGREWTPTYADHTTPVE